MLSPAAVTPTAIPRDCEQGADRVGSTSIVQTAAGVPAQSPFATEAVQDAPLQARPYATHTDSTTPDPGRSVSWVDQQPGQNLHTVGTSTVSSS
ncbi:hypothetical protein WJX72_012510 [[Myrmecia] bisecta]|uniref:Uncharacterized protein n=1 Tax=[Myrmecia] bisecta TaxID=41462 RepID=A0AAW1PUW5_9CHLO